MNYDHFIVPQGAVYLDNTFDRKTTLGGILSIMIGLIHFSASNRKSIIHKNQKEWESHRTGIETVTVIADRHSHQD